MFLLFKFSTLYFFYIIIIICILNVSSVFNYSISSNSAVSHLNKRQISNQNCIGFTCTTTRECINEELKCDGNVDCRDGSDEDVDCKELTCPGYLFTCDYGACIEMSKKCNGKKDCRDNSDEANCIDTEVASVNSSNCKSDQFACNSGHCIPLEKKCDGVYNCADKSDETKMNCLNVECPGYLFKCNYGACVDSFAECNGKKDCVDNSDEENCPGSDSNKPDKPVTLLPDTPPVTVTPVPGSNGCQLPHHPTNGKWTIFPNLTGNPREYVNSGTILEFSCNKKYKLTKESYLICKDNTWKKKEFPTCAKLCPPLYSSQILTVTCKDDRNLDIPCTEAVKGNTADSTCAQYYELSDQRKRFCLNGEWNLPQPYCRPVCGEQKGLARPLIIKGKNVTRGQFPWVAALYRWDEGKFKNVCGGTMLTQKVILTAAHCVADDVGNAVKEDEIRIAVGKYYNEYQDPRDTEAHYSEIERVLVHSQYKGDNRRYFSDIAFLFTKDTMAFSNYVQPICFDNIKLRPKETGVVAGWGYTVANGKPSDVLRYVELEYEDQEVCSKELPYEFQLQYLGADKICVGQHNKSVAVCSGDSGSGFAVPKQSDKGRFYIRGIVSLASMTKDECNIQVRSIFTSVSNHYNLIEEIVSSNP